MVETLQEVCLPDKVFELLRDLYWQPNALIKLYGALPKIIEVVLFMFWYDKMLHTVFNVKSSK